AVSWNPLVKSNPRATSTVAISRRLSILDRDRFEKIRDMLALIHGLLEQVVNVLPLDEVVGTDAIGEEVGQSIPSYAIALALQSVDLASSRLRGLESIVLGNRG